MISASNRTDSRPPGELPRYQVVLDGTDWASLATACGTGESLPLALTRLLDPDPVVSTAAARDVLEEVTHQNTIYEATVPVTRYIAAVLEHPTIAGDDFGHDDTDMPPRRPVLVRLLEWLSDTAYDADDERVAIGERRHGTGFLDDYWEMRAFRDLRPTIYSAVRPLLDHDNADVREAALVAAIPLAEHPALVPHQGELADRARSLLITSTDRHNRDRVLDALKAWGNDTSDLENAEDIAARELYARHMEEQAASIDVWPGRCTEDPPF